MEILKGRLCISVAPTKVKYLGTGLTGFTSRGQCDQLGTWLVTKNARISAKVH